jgi:hypothetical protein
MSKESTPGGSETRKRLQELLQGHNLSYTLHQDEQDGGLALVDKLTPEGDESITRGIEEIEYIVDAILEEFTIVRAAADTEQQNKIKELEEEWTRQIDETDYYRKLFEKANERANQLAEQMRRINAITHESRP